MSLPPKKRIKFQENDIVEASNAAVNEATTTASLPKLQNKKQTVINIDIDDKPLPKRGSHHWCKIFFGEDNQCGGYELDKIVLQLILDEPNVHEKLKSDFTNANIVERFPGLDSFRMQVEGQSADSKNNVEFRTRRQISMEVATPNATKSKKRYKPTFNQQIELKHFTFNFKTLKLPPALFGKPGKLDTRKIFQIEFEKYDAIYKEIILRVKLYSSAVKGHQDYVEATAPDMTHAIPVLDYYFLNKRKQSSTNASLSQYRSSGDDAQRFFLLIREYHSYENRPDPEDSVQDHRLIPQLLDYQKDAVAWMLYREGVLEFSDDDNDSPEQLQKLLLMNISKRLSLKSSGKRCTQEAYYSRASGCVSLEKEMINKLPMGGILADEMGLGKSIEMLSLILLHSRPGMIDLKVELDEESADDVDFDYFYFECTCGIRDRKNNNVTILTCHDCGKSQHSDCLGFNATNGLPVPNKYLCPYCTEKLPPKPSKSTLIVVPNSILKQWEEEIENNISEDSLKIRIYNGFSSGKAYVHPDVLSQYDIVLTTYEVLRHEIHFTDLAEEKRLRDPKRYAALPCPLLLLEWWRVCLDEAQMVENMNSSFAKMARMLPAVNRWCVSGTPIPNSLQDLYGVVCFLGVEPITDIKWWELLIMEPFQLCNSQITITKNLFGKIFWRTEKEDVQEQMRLPRQTELIHRLEFTPAEKYFYNQRSIHWTDAFKASIEGVARDQQISVLNNSQLLPFRRLRDICTHPQLDQEAFKAVDIFIERDAKLTLSVFELVEWLIKSAANKCLKQYRLQVGALNALAGLHLIKNEFEVAARQYRRVLQLAEVNKNRWKTDDVNLLHSLINLADVSKLLGQFDGTLTSKIDCLIAKLMEKKTMELSNCASAISNKEIDATFGVDENAWWILVFSHVNTPNSMQLLLDLVHKLKKTIPSELINMKQDMLAFVFDLENMLRQNLLKILTKRNEIFSDWNKLNSVDTVPTYSKLSLLECGHFTEPVPMNSCRHSPSCLLCSFEKKLSDYESILSREPEERDQVIEDKWMKSWTESILDVIHQFAKKFQLPVTILEDGRRHIQQFGYLHNEIQLFWKWSIKINEHSKAMQALLQETKPIKMNANTTTNVSISSQERMASKTIIRGLSVLGPLQIQPRVELEIAALDQANEEFKCCLRDHQYLKGLQIYGYSSDSSIVELNPETCAVDHISQKWAFLPCNHFVCANCCTETASFELNCSICNKLYSKQMIRFIDTQGGSKHSVMNVPSWKITEKDIWRNPFTKVEAVIRTLLTIRERYPNEKALVICSAPAMLQVFAAEFHQNHISYVLYKTTSKKTNRDTVLRYRTDSTQVLLMPLTVASTGLNLTEANHVLLVEPYANLAIEEQAIGRIHRLGQKKPTFVHRFYVADTIEEKLVRMDKDKKMSTFEEGNMTIQDLFDLFDDNNSCNGAQK